MAESEAEFIAVSNRKGGVGKSTVAIMLAHAAAAYGRRRVLVMDLDTQCNASLMLIGGEAWDKARRAGKTIADYFFDRFDKVAEDESEYVVASAGDVAHPRTGEGRVALLPGSLLLEDVQGELFLKQAKTGQDAELVASQVRTRMKRLMKHFGMDYDLVIMDCPPGLSFAALAALDLADRVVVPFRPDFVSEFALDRASLLIEKVNSAEELAEIALAKRRYACLPNYLRGTPRERLVLEQLALDHPMLTSRLPELASVARAFDWDMTKKTMEQKFGDALPHIRALHDELFGASRALGRRQAV
ncbi:MAG TPA: ParA family protein [Hyphomicrobiaceae bacterium]|nr:ParA family protein [Hyphomicrobiaceae bacterium]